MLVYRLGHPSYIDKLDGEGAALKGGRWNHKGERVIYTAQTSSLAILEVLGHISNTQFLIPYQLAEITIDEGLVLDYRKVSPKLPEGWALHKTGEQITKDIGSEWLKKKASTILRVPSVHNPLEHNFLLNPLHPKFKAASTNKHWYLYHERLVKQP